MSDQARDDLVAAMEAVDAYYKASKPWDEDQSREHCYLACSAFIRKHGKHLLALLDAEPVAWRYELKDLQGRVLSTDVRASRFPDDADPELTAMGRRGYDFHHEYTVAESALYARPEASDE